MDDFVNGILVVVVCLILVGGSAGITYSLTKDNKWTCTEIEDANTILFEDVNSDHQVIVHDKGCE